MSGINGLVFNIQRFSIHDGPGTRAVIFFMGCNLHCLWCHNPESQSTRPVLEFYPAKCIGCGLCVPACKKNARTADGIDRGLCDACGDCTDTCYAKALVRAGEYITAEEAITAASADAELYRATGGGVTLSGGECLLQPDFALELLRGFHERGISTAVDTAGNLPFSVFERVIPYTDLFLYDIKADDSALHRRLTGAGNERIKDNLRRLIEAGCRVSIRVPCIPGLNDGELEPIGAYLKSIGAPEPELLLYHKLGASKYTALGIPDPTSDIPAPPRSELVRYSRILSEAYFRS